MCTVSNVGDDWRNNFPDKFPNFPNPFEPYPPFRSPRKVRPVETSPTIKPFEQMGITREEFDALKREVEDLKKKLEEAKKFDEATGQKDCHMEEKVEFIKKIAEFVGVDLGDVFVPMKK